MPSTKERWSTGKHLRLRERQGDRCCYCQETVSFTLPYNHPRAATREHLKRKSEGGNLAVDNLALACRECNLGRGDMDWLTYTSYKRGELILGE